MARARDRGGLIAIGVVQSESVPSVLSLSNIKVISTSRCTVTGDRWSIGDFSMSDERWTFFGVCAGAIIHHGGDELPPLPPLRSVQTRVRFPVGESFSFFWREVRLCGGDEGLLAGFHFLTV